MSAPSLVCTAIRERRRLSFLYDGLRRIVEPHAHGTSTQGKELLRAEQVGGSSRSGVMGSKLWEMAKVEQLTVLDQTFVPGTNFRKGDRGMARVHCEL